MTFLSKLTPMKLGFDNEIDTHSLHPGLGGLRWGFYELARLLRLRDEIIS
jgi:hypothetical protein